MPNKILSTSTATARLLARTTKPAATKSAKPATPARVLRRRGKSLLALPTPESVAPVNPDNVTPESIVNAPVTPVASSVDPLAGLSERGLARLAAQRACEAFYAGPSIPFKFRGDLRRLSPVNFAQKAEPTHRAAASIALLLAYCEIQSDYSFERGSGKMPGSLLGKTGSEAKTIYRTGIESGVLSQLLGGGAVSYVSGATSGIGAESAIFRINPDAARKHLLPHNSKRPDASGMLFSSTLRLLRTLETKHAAAAKAAASETPAPADIVDYDTAGNPVAYA